jgi:hypothetical protein
LYDSVRDGGALNALEGFSCRGFGIGSVLSECKKQEDTANEGVFFSRASPKRIYFTLWSSLVGKLPISNAVSRVYGAQWQCIIPLEQIRNVFPFYLILELPIVFSRELSSV